MDNIINEKILTEVLENSVEWITTQFPGLIVILIVFFLAFRLSHIFAGKLKAKLTERAEKNTKVDKDEAIKRINTLVDITHKTLNVILWVVFLMLVLQKLSVNIGPILASVGILGLAIGFGAQELVRDFISGFFIILENQIRTGDVAVINGTGGLVEKIELRTIVLRDFSGTVHIFQNGKISDMANMTKDWSAMVFDIGVAYKEDPQVVMDIMKKVGEELQNDPDFADDIIEPIEIFGLDKFADSALVIKGRFKTRPIKQWVVGREYRKRLNDAFNKNNIEIPFPHTTVYWGEEINPLKLDIEKYPGDDRDNGKK